MKSKRKVLVGMSGGVDSSVVAALLKEQGYDCVGVYMNLWADPTVFDLEDKKTFPQNKCCSIGSLMAARSICQRLEIPFYSINFEDIFKSKVVDFFLEGFREGETPNPCVRCNKTVKFGALFKKMEELGCDFLATGHYAKLITNKDGVVELHRGKDIAKDQTYFLYNLSQDRLKRIIFPLGDFDKPAVKKMAAKYGFKELEHKRESQGVCFYPEKTYFEFLKRYLKNGEDFEEGNIEDAKGKKIGIHDGLPFYTVGQRKGIGVGGGPALYVHKTDSIRNVLIVGSADELMTKSVKIRDVNFLAGVAPSKEETLLAKIRSQGSLNPCSIKQNEEEFVVEFDQPQRGIMAGQSLVLYRRTELVGGGIMSW